MTLAFNLETAILAAEAGDSGLWEEIARHLIKTRRKPAARKSKGAYVTWAHVTLADGREFLTSETARKTEDETRAAHAAYAQFRARMEDSGDLIARVWLNPRVKPKRVKSVCLLINGRAQIEEVRTRCFNQRMVRAAQVAIAA